MSSKALGWQAHDQRAKERTKKRLSAVGSSSSSAPNNPEQANRQFTKRKSKAHQQLAISAQVSVSQDPVKRRASSISTTQPRSSVLFPALSKKLSMGRVAIAEGNEVR